jgi:hypothetical protein
MVLEQWANDTLAHATGRDQRNDPVRPGTGGPAGNARLTAWTGLLLLVLFLIEMATLLDLDPLLDWHVIVGVLLVPPALLKTASTGWRIVRYYTHRPDYRRAGPPPMLLRLLGPLVVLFTLAVLGTGLALIPLGPDGSRTALLTVFGHEVSAVTLHAATFVLWAGVTGLHALCRLVPALQIVRTPAHTDAVPGKGYRIGALVLTLAVAGYAAAIVAGADGPWLADSLHTLRHHPDHVRSRHD